MSLARTLGYIVRHPLSRGRVVANVARFGAWQVRARLMGGESSFVWVDRTRLLVKPGMTSATGHLYVGLQEFEDMAFVVHLLRPGDLFVDVGANIGAYTVLAAGVAGADTIAFEPGSEARIWLQRNVSLNQLDARVTVRKEAIGDGDRLVRFSVGRDTTNAIVTNPARTKSTATVTMTTLDAVCASRTPTLLKIDVEGFEALVLRGAETILGDPELQAIVIELNGAGAAMGVTDEAICFDLRRRGFAMFAYKPFERQLHPLAALSARPPGQDNVIFVRQALSLENRLKSARSFRVRGWTI